MSRVSPGSDAAEAAGVVDYQSITLAELAELVATPSPAPAGGSVAAVAAMLAAALATMTARLSSGHWDTAGAASAQAQALRARLEPLAREDAAAYLRALAEMRGSEDEGESGASPSGAEATSDRDASIAAALEEAAAVPLRIAEAAADVAQLAAEIARLGNPAVTADAVAAVALARASAQAAAFIVDVNLGVTSEDELAQRAKRAVEAADAASHRALAAGR